MSSELIRAVVIAILGSSAFWTAFLTVVHKFISRKSAANQMLLSLGHDRILTLAELYIKCGYITADEFENLHDYLFVSYTKLGGNGTAKMMMDKVKQLPIHDK